jgi:hypothetical protein
VLSAARRLILEDIDEKTWRQQVVDWCEQRGALCYFTWDSRNSPAGFPDVFIVKGEDAWSAELKTMKGELGALQRVWKAALSQVKRFHGGLVWRPSDEEEILAALGPVEPSRLLPRRGGARSEAWSSTRARATSAAGTRRPRSTARVSTRRRRAPADSKR